MLIWFHPLVYFSGGKYKIKVNVGSCLQDAKCGYAKSLIKASCDLVLSPPHGHDTPILVSSRHTITSCHPLRRLLLPHACAELTRA